MSPGPAYLLNPCFAMRLSRCLGAGAPGAGCWIRESCISEAFDSASNLPRKEVIQPHLPVRLPCYDFTPVMKPTVDAAFLSVGQTSSGEPHSHGVTGGVYKTRERIHRGMLIRDY